MKKFFSEFRDFINKGSVMDMAVGIIVGGAFTAIVNALVDSMLNPLLGSIFKSDFSNLSFMLNGAEVKYGAFIMAIINFVIVAFVLFLVIKGLNTLREASAKITKAKKESEGEDAPTTKICPFCKSEIPADATRCAHCTSELYK